MPPISIITPSYQGEPFYERYFSHLAKQTQKNFEIVICLRLSHSEESTESATSKIRSVAEHYGLNDHLVICFDLEERGVAQQRNLAMALAKGNYFSFLDIDDTWLPARCERVDSWLSEHPDADLLHHMMTIHNEGQGGINEYPLSSAKKTTLKDLLIGQDILNSSVVMQRKIFNRGWRQESQLNVSQDWGGWLHIADLSYRIEYLPENWGTYHWSNNSLSSLSELALDTQTFLVQEYRRKIAQWNYRERLTLGLRLSIFYYTAGLTALRQRNKKLSRERLWQAWASYPFQLRVPLQLVLNTVNMEIWDLKKMASGKLPRVMIVLPSLKMGGAERAMTTLLSTVDLTRAEWHLVLLHPRTEEAYEVPKGIIVHELNSSRLITSLPALLAKIHRFAPMAVISTLTYLNIALCGLRALLPRSTRLICREASLLRTNSEHEKYPTRFRSLVGWCYPLADHIVCLSEQMKRELVDHSKLPDHQCVVIPNGSTFNTNPAMKINLRPESTSPFSNHGTGPHIIVVGRLEHNKGGHTAIKAFSTWKVSHPDAQLWFLGSGSCLEVWGKCARDTGINESVHFAGQQHDLMPWYQHADLMLMTSQQEGLPNVLIEAIAMGCPVQVLQHEGGGLEILNKVGLQERWVTHLDQPLLDRSLCTSASTTCREVYDQNKVTEAWEQLIFKNHGQD